MKKGIRKILRILRLEDTALKALPIVRRSIWLLRLLTGFEKRLFKKYLRENTVKKLHVGCGSHTLNGWLNTDCFPLSLSISHLDATRAFPFSDETFDFVFSEHMIEHISYPHGLTMLSECFRVLKRGGRIRLSTPDLAFLVALAHGGQSALEKAYVAWATETMIRYAPYPAPVFLINHFMRSWGHQFIYDARTLAETLNRVGFTNIERCSLNISEVPTLCNLENEKRMPEGFLRLETMTLEAVKTTDEHYRKEAVVSCWN